MILLLDAKITPPPHKGKKGSSLHSMGFSLVAWKLYS